MEQPVFYRTVKIDGLSIFCRKNRAERCSRDSFPGIPSSSRMFQPLLTSLASNYHLVAPDYLGVRCKDRLTQSSNCTDLDAVRYTILHIGTLWGT